MMRLSNFIIDTQILSDPEPDVVYATSTPGIKTDNIRIFQGMLIENEFAGEGQHHMLVASGSVTSENLLSGDQLTLAGSFSGKYINVDDDTRVYTLTVADGEHKG